ncbi:hypothetical protein TSAR_014565 [Trichomalopsis sarcophagae]|uniref:DDE Tnp4 domain-containing protein n=1 Tax=Trichomalopsis sarcophagae TaxID=543379 RepID=A0A232ERS7_9HYME|nr:hypothetical protein TSAR_014565 [Trichomalopsis sarcophagae]
MDEESLLTAKIATARVYIERSNQRIKTFKILGSILPSTLMPLIEDIFIVICGTVNMSAPIALISAVFPTIGHFISNKATGFLFFMSTSSASVILLVSLETIGSCLPTL